MKKVSQASDLATLLLAPTQTAYLMFVLRYRLVGMAIYVGLIYLAYHEKVFENIREWPRVTQYAVYAGPLHMAAGLYFSTQAPSYTMMLPGVAYALLSILGGVALTAHEKQKAKRST